MRPVSPQSSGVNRSFILVCENMSGGRCWEAVGSFFLCVAKNPQDRHSWLCFAIFCNSPCCSPTWKLGPDAESPCMLTGSRWYALVASTWRSVRNSLVATVVPNHKGFTPYLLGGLTQSFPISPYLSPCNSGVPEMASVFSMLTPEPVFLDMFSSSSTSSHGRRELVKSSRSFLTWAIRKDIQSCITPSPSRG